jgi:hypothetical protein
MVLLLIQKHVVRSYMMPRKVAGHVQKDGSVFVALEPAKETVIVAEGSWVKGRFPIPQNAKALYAAPQDASLTVAFNYAGAPAVTQDKVVCLKDHEMLQYLEAANKSNYLGHNDWRLPTPEEVLLLIKGQDRGSLKDTFSNDKNSFYWMGNANAASLQAQRFSDGYHSENFIRSAAHLRLVRTEDVKPSSKKKIPQP